MSMAVVSSSPLSQRASALRRAKATCLTSRTAPRRTAQPRQRGHRARAFEESLPSSRAAGAAVDDDEGDGDDFYSILEVSPTATSVQIRRAYYRAMKQCHPDRTASSLASLSSLSSDGDDAFADESDFNGLAALLNEIYATLMDDHKRAMYDLMMGYNSHSVNPFHDSSYELDQVFVDEQTCIGCRACAGVCPSTFAMEEEWGRARVAAQNNDPEDVVQEAMDTCPVNCIHWVSAPMLVLLEDQMRQMDRIGVMLLMRGAGRKSGADVFRLASYHWERRAAAARERAERDVGGRARARWEAAVGVNTFRSAERAEEAAERGAAPTPRAAKELASTAARAARVWREYCRSRDRRGAYSRGLRIAESSSMSSTDDARL
ncbi:unnamed protein product [Pedinophyceae sp. YPF-701]|nr:unnamed protein product [Pedinophyceae sp. YPF-701]